MAERGATGRGAAGGAGLRERVQANPGANRLVEEAEAYVQARVEQVMDDMVHRLEDAATRIGEAHLGPHELLGVLGDGGRRLKAGASPSAAVLGAAASHAKDALVGKVKDLSGKRQERKRSGAPAGTKSLMIVEDVEVGVPLREAYDQWTQFQDFGRFAKGVVNVEKEDDSTSQWQVKIAKATRHWQGKVTEMVPDERIAWTSEAAKGTTKGVVTFHPLGENLTKVLLVMEYFPHGLVEKTGALMRAQGRRARLDLKLYRAFLTMRGEATGGWRGEIRDGEVVREPEEDEKGGGREAEERGDEQDERYDDESAQPYEDEDEDAYEEEAEEEDDKGRSREPYGDGEDEYEYEDEYEGDEGAYEEEAEEEPQRRRSGR